MSHLPRRLFLTAAAALVAAAGLGLPAMAAAPAPLGDDGLHHATWMHDTFRNLSDDLAEANASGKRLLLIVEQRGCIYCTRMHEKVFTDDRIAKLLTDKFFVVQVNLFGDTEVTDFDGTALPEKKMANKWGVMFTPTMIFLPEEVPEGKGVRDAAVAMMPGAFEKGTTLDLLEWVLAHGYDTGENFQTYVQSKVNDQIDSTITPPTN
ncbi:DUF255 domain-containing protein [Paracoccus suum]|uniref:DUF255 domain-containing protein n=1 Tax=Paracoccus suum TaxID=2259340 RepID=A0A344PJR7_9RHOB|nr:thioredoxin family protein [Paracoccus suum]AXC49622.1 DUF255 domain-containing protein [Paracoccus suum]